METQLCVCLCGVFKSCFLSLLMNTDMFELLAGLAVALGSEMKVCRQHCEQQMMFYLRFSS